jgi:hypothetical protein
MEANVELIDVAATAVAPIPAGWRRHEGHLIGMLKGAHGGYVVIVDTTSSPLVRVEVVLPESVPAGLEARLAEACLQANRDWPGARLYCTARFDNAIAAEGSLTVGPYASEIDPLIVRALVLRCITTAASIPPLVSAIERGVSPYDAPSLASDNQILAFAGSGRMVPSSDADLMDACLAAAEHAEWPARRAESEYGNGPNCAHVIVEHGDLGPPAIATVEARDGCLYATTVVLGPEERQRVPVERLAAVAELLNGLANRTSRCAFALDLEEGFIRTDLILDTAGCTSPPSRELLCDFVFQAATSGAFFRQMVASVAHQGVEPETALETFEVNVGSQESC